MNGALIRYRVMAWIVGVMLLFVTAATIVKYAADSEGFIQVVGPMHGFLYVVYLATVLDLGLRVRWSGLKIIVICLAGTIPFLSFYAEHRISQEIKAKLAATQATTPS